MACGAHIAGLNSITDYITPGAGNTPPGVFPIGGAYFLLQQGAFRPMDIDMLQSPGTSYIDYTDKNELYTLV